MGDARVDHGGANVNVSGVRLGASCVVLRKLVTVRPVARSTAALKGRGQRVLERVARG